MISNEITICGKQVKVAYCYATEINYKRKTGEEVSNYFADARDSFGKNEFPDAEKTMCLIHAAMAAYYGNDMPLSLKDMENESLPMELAKALGILISLRSEFYTIPDELQSEEEEGDKKNV